MPRKPRLNTEDDVFFCNFLYCRYSTWAAQNLKRHKTKARHYVDDLAIQQRGPIQAGPDDAGGDIRSDAEAQMGVDGAPHIDMQPTDTNMESGAPSHEDEALVNEPAEG